MGYKISFAYFVFLISHYTLYIPMIHIIILQLIATNRFIFPLSQSYWPPRATCPERAERLVVNEVERVEGEPWSVKPCKVIFNYFILPIRRSSSTFVF